MNLRFLADRLLCRGRPTLIALLGFTVVSGCVNIDRHLYRQLKPVLAATHRSEHFDFHYRPGSDTERHLRRISMAAERELEGITRQLAVANDIRYAVFLFREATDIGKASGNPQWGGFAVGRTICAVYDDDGARLHEMVHAVAINKIGHGRNPVLVEGLACALFDTPYDDVHALVKHYRLQRRLPTMTDLAGITTEAKWDAWLGNTEVNLYSVSGSWMQFLLESFGAEKTKRYYVGGDPNAAFGLSLADLEQRWHAMLDRYPLSPAREVEFALTQGGIDLRYTRFLGDRDELRFVIPEAEGLDISYQWHKDGIALPGATASALRFDHLTLADGGVYTALFTIRKNGETTAKGSNSTLLTVVPPEQP